MSFDVIVLGAGVAGTVAAILLRRANLRVCVLEQEPRVGKSAVRPEWIGAAGLRLCEQEDLSVPPSMGDAFAGITFHSTDLKKTASCPGDKPACRVDYTQLVVALRKQARDADVCLNEGAQPERIELQERQVNVRLADAEPISARFLLLADGASRSFFQANLAGAPRCDAIAPGAQGRWFAALRIPVNARSAEAKALDNHLHWLLTPAREDRCLVWWRDGNAVVITLLACGTDRAVAAELCEMAGELVERKLIPAGKGIDPAGVLLRPAPVRFALDVESHVDKRCLLIGDAGGFVSQVSGEGLYPALWSAKLGCECLLRAMDSRHPQDELRGFSTAWRSTMADYLRPPNTDMHFLLPLVFNNEQMAQRMAAAFWRGENI